MRPIKFKVDDVTKSDRGWQIIAHATEAGYFKSGPTARLAGCRVEELAPLPELPAKALPHETRRVFLLKNQEEHERFVKGQKLLLDP